MAGPEDTTVAVFDPPDVTVVVTGATAAPPPEATRGAAVGVVAAARPGWVRPTPTSKPTARPRAAPMPRNRDVVDMAGAPLDGR
jgi:hypothetical protein